jgi:hypothetical protein
MVPPTVAPTANGYDGTQAGWLFKIAHWAWHGRIEGVAEAARPKGD